MPASDAVARCEAVGVRYPAAAGEVNALRAVDASFVRANLNVIAGPSGSGKSSLLRVLGGLQPHSAGHSLVEGHDLTRLSRRGLRRFRRRRVGFILQAPADNLIDYLPAIDQVTLAARLRGASPAGAASLLAAVGLENQLRRYPHQLSGGEQQRVAFAAAAIGAPAVVLADEPTAQLDAAAGAAVVSAMRDLVRDGTSLIVASHDDAVIAAADAIVRLRDGRVEDR